VVFWAEQQQIFSARNADTFTLGSDAKIRIDGEVVALKAGIMSML
jgi:flagellar hook-associated protein 3 FlgL